MNIEISKMSYNKLFNKDPHKLVVKKLVINYTDTNDNISTIEFIENNAININNIKQINTATYGSDKSKIDVKKKIDFLLKNSNKPTILHVSKKGSGFFSYCSLRLSSLISFFNEHNKCPNIVDSQYQFRKYYISSYKDGNAIVSYMFGDYNNNINISFTKKINYHWSHQYNIYKTLDFNSLNPFIEKYFSPSKSTQDIIETIEKKYNIDYINTCVLFYRGGDKCKETKLAPYSEFFEQADKIKKDNPNIQFLIQSDETNFINGCLERYSNSFYFKDEIRHMNNRKTVVDNVKFKNGSNFTFVHKYLAITIIMSKCNYIICPSGNCSIWIVFYRGHAENVIQYKDNKWYK